jgi:hypothetical protein
VRVSECVGHVLRTYQIPENPLLPEVSGEPDVVNYRSYLTIDSVRDIKANEVAENSAQSAPATDEV